MNPSLFAFLLACTTFSAIFAKPTADECKCWEGYQSNKGQNGLECEGILVFHTMPCNEPQPPRCKCSGNVTGILKDATGTWCSTYNEGKEIKRWECENKEEWKKFYEDHPDYKP